MEKRTDLAVECYEESKKTEISGVKVVDENGVTTVSVLNENGEKEIGKPVGTYITVDVPSFVNDTDIFDGRLKKISGILKNLLPAECDNVLVAGLGNMDITADALGPKTNSYVLATRHISSDLRREMGFENLKSVSTVRTGVLGETGIESAEIIKGIVNVINPSCVLLLMRLPLPLRKDWEQRFSYLTQAFFRAPVSVTIALKFQKKRLAYLLFQSVFQRLFQQAL